MASNVFGAIVFEGGKTVCRLALVHSTKGPI
jgi:hypothetical protein